MPAVSKAQQKFMGMVHALQQGEIDPKDVSPEVRKAAKTMKKKDAEDFASTKHKGLPAKKEMKESADKDLVKSGIQYAKKKYKYNRADLERLAKELLIYMRSGEIDSSASMEAYIDYRHDETWDESIQESAQDVIVQNMTGKNKDKVLMVLQTNKAKRFFKDAPTDSKGNKLVAYDKKELSKIKDFLQRNNLFATYVFEEECDKKKKIKENNGDNKMPKKTLKELMYSKKERKLLEEAIFPEEPEPVSPEIKEKALKAIKEYNKYGKMIYREGNLVEIAKLMSEMAKFAERFTTENASDWFDNVTIKRNMKELNTLSSDFAKIAKEVQTYQDRMTALYEDMGTIFNRYFEIEELVEEPESVTKETDEFLRKGDRAKVDMNAVRRSNPTPSYVRKVREEVSRGKGTVRIQELTKKKAIVSGGDINLTEIEIPTNALTKVVGNRLEEAVKYDEEKMKKYVMGDKFLNAQYKTGTKLKVLFNTYVLGDSVMEREYDRVKV